MFLPRTIPHTFQSVGGPARVLLIGTPAGLDEYFAALRRAGDSGAGPQEFSRIQQTYGIVTV